MNGKNERENIKAILERTRKGWLYVEVLNTILTSESWSKALNDIEAKCWRAHTVYHRRPRAQYVEPFP
jgi:hypothetical protein